MSWSDIVKKEMPTTNTKQINKKRTNKIHPSNSEDETKLNTILEPYHIEINDLFYDMKFFCEK